MARVPARSRLQRGLQGPACSSWPTPRLGGYTSLVFSRRPGVMATRTESFPSVWQAEYSRDRPEAATGRVRGRRQSRLQWGAMETASVPGAAVTFDPHTAPAPKSWIGPRNRLLPLYGRSPSAEGRFASGPKNPGTRPQRSSHDLAGCPTEGTALDADRGGCGQAAQPPSCDAKRSRRRLALRGDVESRHAL